MIRIDSRRVEPGDLFIAIGRGLDYLQEVAEKGVQKAIIQEDYSGAAFGLELTRVPDTRFYLQELARGRKKPCVVGVTGSVGKTTTKEILASMLRQRWRVFVTPGNQNSQVGLPLSVLEAPEDAEVWVLEMAMSEAGQIRRLTEIAPPDFALITKVVYKHAENFDSLEAIAAAKGEIFSQPGVHIAPHPWPGVLTFSSDDPLADYWTGPPHLAENFVAAATVAREMGLTIEEITKAEVPKIAQRFSVTNRKGITIVDDTYNTCAASIHGALQSLPKGRRVGFLSEMRELGTFSKELHEQVGVDLLGHLDALYCIGPEAKCWEEIWRAAGKPCVHLPDKEALLAAAKREARAGDVLLFKGSRVYALEEVASRLLEAL